MTTSFTSSRTVILALLFTAFFCCLNLACGQGAEAATTPGATEEKGYDVILTAVGPSKIAVIKEVREAVPGIGLAEAKTLVETAPQPVRRQISKDEAERLQQKFEAAGATVSIESGGVAVKAAAESSLDPNGRYDVILVETGASKIAVIKEVRGAVAGIGLADAKTFVENLPQPIKRGATKEEAERLQQAFGAAGAKVIIQ